MSGGDQTTPAVPRRKWCRVLWTIATLAGMFAWLLHFPLEEEALYRAVSPDALWVSEHDRLADRWYDIADNPVLLGVMGGLEVTADEAQDFMKKSTWRNFFRLMTGQRAVVSCERFRDRPVWVITTWVGGPIHLVRWNILPRLIPGMTKVDYGLNRDVWVLPLDSKKSGKHRKLVLTTQEGMLVGVIAETPRFIGEVLERINCSKDERRLGWHPGQSFDEQPYPDRGWLLASTLANGIKIPEIHAGLVMDTTAEVAGEIRLPTIQVMPGDRMEPAASRGLRWLLASQPDVLLTGSETFLRGVGIIPAESRRWQNLLTAIQTIAPEAKTLCAAVLSEPFSGRIHGIKIPSLLLGFPVGEGVGLDSPLSLLVDDMNQEHAWELVATITNVAGHNVALLDPVGEAHLAGLEAADKPACVVVEGWFFCLSNLTALEAMLKVGVPTGDDPALAARLSTSLYGQSDLNATFMAVRNLFSVYLLSKAFSEKSEKNDMQIRGAYGAMHRWAPVAAALKSAECWVEAPDKGSGLTLNVRLGPDSAGRKGLN